MPNKNLTACLRGLRLLSFFFLIVGFWALTASAQTYRVIHNFTGAGDGSVPYASLIIDRAGNVYGTTALGALGNGTVFKLTHRNSSWVLTTLHAFSGGDDGVAALTPPFLAPSGILYGTTSEGGGVGSCNTGCGTAFQLRPLATRCVTVQCSWMETVLYRFAGLGDGGRPSSGVIADSAGNLYGETESFFNGFCGVVYELQPSGGGWTENVLYSFICSGEDISPGGGLVLDSAGNLFGTSQGQRASTVFELYRSGGEWLKRTIYLLPGRGHSVAGLVLDGAGNLYGAADTGGCCGAGYVFELSPSGGSWNFTDLYDFTGAGPGSEGPMSTLAIDAQGNLYGATNNIGAFHQGNVFKLSPSGSGWTYTDLHDFTGGDDGSYPIGGVVLDSAGNIYGTTSTGGANSCSENGCGVVFEITP